MIEKEVERLIRFFFRRFFKISKTIKGLSIYLLREIGVSKWYLQDYWLEIQRIDEVLEITQNEIGKT